MFVKEGKSSTFMGRRYICRIEAPGVEAFGSGSSGVLVVQVEESSTTVKVEGEMVGSGG